MSSPHYTDGPVTIWHGDCLDVMRRLPDASVDAVVTDPPYGLSNTDPEHVVKTLTRWLAGDRDYLPSTGAGFMGKAWDAFVPPVAVWDEALRILKPGGHVLCFAGTRTVDLMTLALRLAGFEIRDSIAWLYGSGFPKSLDVGKAIDKAAGAEREAIGPDRGRLIGGTGGTSTNHGRGGVAYGLDAPTAPATADAARWNGWGTALKPAFEPIVVARKPLGGAINVRARIEHELRARGVEGEIRWTNEPANAAAQPDPQQSSSSTPPRQAAETSAAPADGSATPNDAKRTGNGSATSTAPGGTLTLSTSAPTTDARQPSSAPKSSLPMAPAASAAANRTTSSSSSTTSTAEALPTADPTGARSITSSADSASLPAIGSFAGIATGLTGSQAHVHIERNVDGIFVWPEALPQVVTAGGTVAANVLAYGTGALNIDASRVGNGPSPSVAMRASGRIPAPLREQETAAESEARGRLKDRSSPEAWAAARSGEQLGRWPANVILDASQAAALDAQSGTLSTGGGDRGTTSRDGLMGPDSDRGRTTRYSRKADTGGASRFFKTVDTVTPRFMYTAKAGSDERPTYSRTGGASTPGGAIAANVCATCGRQDLSGTRCECLDPQWVPRGGGDAVSHPTVKPLDLMRWLVKLVTPPGGVVLEPFAGSGTTVEAAVLEGFRCVAIEREGDYLPLILQRIRKPHAVGLDLDWDDPTPVPTPIRPAQARTGPRNAAPAPHPGFDFGDDWELDA